MGPVVRMAAAAAAIALVAGCGSPEADPGTARPTDSGISPEDGSSAVIHRLAQGKLALEDFDVCEAVRDAGAEDDIAEILAVESVSMEGSYAESEDSLRLSCAMTASDDAGGDTEFSVDVMQMSEGRADPFPRAPKLFAGCRIVDPRIERGDPNLDRAGLRVWCEPNLFADLDPDFPGDSAISAWPDGSVDGMPSEEYVDLMNRLLVSLSAQA